MPVIRTRSGLQSTGASVKCDNPCCELPTELTLAGTSMSRPSTGMGFLAVTGSTPPSRDGAIKSSCRTVPLYRWEPGENLGCLRQKSCQHRCCVVLVAGQQSSSGKPSRRPDACTHKEDAREIWGELSNGLAGQPACCAAAAAKQPCMHAVSSASDRS